MLKFKTSKVAQNNFNNIEPDLGVEGIHTVILSDRTLKKWALSSFAFQFYLPVFLGIHRNPKQKYFLIRVRDFWDNPIYPLG